VLPGAGPPARYLRYIYRCCATQLRTFPRYPVPRLPTLPTTTTHVLFDSWLLGLLRTITPFTVTVTIYTLRTLRLIPTTTYPFLPERLDSTDFGAVLLPFVLGDTCTTCSFHAPARTYVTVLPVTTVAYDVLHTAIPFDHRFLSAYLSLFHLPAPAVCFYVCYLPAYHRTRSTILDLPVIFWAYTAFLHTRYLFVPATDSAYATYHSISFILHSYSITVELILLIRLHYGILPPTIPHFLCMGFVHGSTIPHFIPVAFVVRCFHSFRHSIRLIILRSTIRSYVPSTVTIRPHNSTAYVTLLIIPYLHYRTYYFVSTISIPSLRVPLPVADTIYLRAPTPCDLPPLFILDTTSIPLTLQFVTTTFHDWRYLHF